MHISPPMAQPPVGIALPWRATFGPTALTTATIASTAAAAVAVASTTVLVSVAVVLGRIAIVVMTLPPGSRQPELVASAHASNDLCRFRQAARKNSCCARDSAHR